MQIEYKKFRNGISIVKDNTVKRSEMCFQIKNYNVANRCQGEVIFVRDRELVSLIENNKAVKTFFFLNF